MKREKEGQLPNNCGRTSNNLAATGLLSTCWMQWYVQAIIYTYYVAIYSLGHVEKVCIYFPVFMCVRKRKTKEKEREKTEENSSINLFIFPSKRVTCPLNVLGTTYE